MSEATCIEHERRECRECHDEPDGSRAPRDVACQRCPWCGTEDEADVIAGYDNYEDGLRCPVCAGRVTLVEEQDHISTPAREVAELEEYGYE